MLDANTFTNHQISAYLNDNFINLKIDAETPYGQKLFSQFNGEGYPLILFLDQKQKELDRFYGFYKPKNFLEKLKAIIEGGNTFSNLFQKYELGDRSSETISLLAKKYAERNSRNIVLPLLGYEANQIYFFIEFKDILTQSFLFYNCFLFFE